MIATTIANGSLNIVNKRVLVACADKMVAEKGRGESFNVVMFRHHEERQNSACSLSWTRPTKVRAAMPIVAPWTTTEKMTTT